MSWDLFVEVSRLVTKEELNRTLQVLDCPLSVDEEPSEASGYFHVLVANTGINGLDGSLAGGFELCAGDRDDDNDDDDEEDGEHLAFWYSLSLQGDEDADVAWIIALGLAKAGQGFVEDPQEGRAHRLPALEKRWEGRIRKLRAGQVRRWEALPIETKSFLRRWDGETTVAHQQRLEDRALQVHGTSEAQARHLQVRLGAALDSGEEEKISKALDLFAPASALLEPGLDACFHAARPDVARRYLAGFPPGALRAHFLEAAGFVGVHAPRYVGFLLEVGGVELDEPTRAAAAGRAVDAETRHLLGG